MTRASALVWTGAIFLTSLQGCHTVMGWEESERGLGNGGTSNGESGGTGGIGETGGSAVSAGTGGTAGAALDGGSDVSLGGNAGNAGRAGSGGETQDDGSDVSIGGSAGAGANAGAGGTAGEAGQAGSGGSSGSAGTAGAAGASGFSGSGGSSGMGGAAGTGGSAGFAGSGGSSGSAGTAGAAGTSGFAGSGGSAGSSGMGGAAGTGGSAGFAGSGGSSGSAGTAGAAGTSGFAGSGGSAGSSGMGGAAGTAGSGGSSGNGGSDCGNPTGGPQMIEMPHGYCIDATEVTNSQYKAWLDTNPSTTGQISACSWNDDFTPTVSWPPWPQTENYPVTYVDWCDAYAYCKAVGKRLCGKIGGGSNRVSDYARASQSQWYAACSSAGQRNYPYGDNYQSTTCNGKNAAHNTTVEVGTMKTCQSSITGYMGVFDLSGNVREWEDSCRALGGPGASCQVRGGSYVSSDSQLRCDYNDIMQPTTTSEDVGFRCCSSP